jgi:hypothetical protein
MDIMKGTNAAPREKDATMTAAMSNPKKERVRKIHSAMMKAIEESVARIFSATTSIAVITSLWKERALPIPIVQLLVSLVNAAHRLWECT